MSLLYWLLSYLVLGLLLPFLSLHPKLRQGWRRRLGLYTRKPWPNPDAKGPRIWFHGASAGDLIAILPTIQLVREARPDATLIVSTMTNSGFEIGNKKVSPYVDAVTFIPYDFVGATRRSVAALQPDILVLEYAEIWPNLISAAHRAGAKLVLTNGRFSESLMGRYRWLYFLVGNPLKKMSTLLMRDLREAERALELGTPNERVHVTGNTKFDNVAKAPDATVVESLREKIIPNGEPVFVAGSTHEGEEKSIIEAFVKMRAVSPNLKCVIAPRYIERAAKIVALAKQESLRSGLRSELATLTQAESQHLELVVVDTLGELTAVYQLATIAFVGGSFIKRGGQNILEPAGQGRPVLFGPYMANFRDSVEILQGRGGIQVGDAKQLAKVGQELLERPDEIERLGAMAKDSVTKVRGASKRNAAHIISLL